MSGKTNQVVRVAVVTGGAGAIGGAIVTRLAPADGGLVMR